MSDRVSISHGEAMTEIARQSPEAVGLVGQILAASAASTFGTMDALYEREREHRQALEMHIQHVLDRFDEIRMGTVREYEACVAALEFVPTGERLRQLAASHPQNDPN